jgi:hypothetical protein
MPLAPLPGGGAGKGSTLQRLFTKLPHEPEDMPHLTIIVAIYDAHPALIPNAFLKKYFKVILLQTFKKYFTIKYFYLRKKSLPMCGLCMSLTSDPLSFSKTAGCRRKRFESCSTACSFCDLRQTA